MSARIEVKVNYGEVSAVGKMLGVSKAAASKGIKAGNPDYLNALAKVRKSANLKKQKALQNLARASRMAETENIRLHDEYLRETRPEMMQDFFNT